MKKLLSLLSAMVLASFVIHAEDTFPTISHDDLKKVVAEKKVVLLDVNGTDTWKEGHIPGALNFESIENGLAAKLPSDKDTLIVAYCGNERCTAYRAGASAAKKLGYKNVKHYAKGIAGWKKAGEPVEKGQ